MCCPRRRPAGASRAGHRRQRFTGGAAPVHHAIGLELYPGADAQALRRPAVRARGKPHGADTAGNGTAGAGRPGVAYPRNRDRGNQAFRSARNAMRFSGRRRRNRRHDADSAAGQTPVGDGSRRPAEPRESCPPRHCWRHWRRATWTSRPGISPKWPIRCCSSSFSTDTTFASRALTMPLWAIP